MLNTAAAHEFERDGVDDARPARILGKKSVNVNVSREVDWAIPCQERSLEVSLGECHFLVIYVPFIAVSLRGYSAWVGHS